MKAYKYSVKIIVDENSRLVGTQNRIYVEGRFVVGFRGSQVDFFSEDERDLLREAKVIESGEVTRTLSLLDFDEYQGCEDVDSGIVDRIATLGRKVNNDRKSLEGSLSALKSALYDLS